MQKINELLKYTIVEIITISEKKDSQAKKVYTMWFCLQETFQIED